MRVITSDRQTRYDLEPGEYYVTDKPAIISTLLGSCVSACLFDPINRIIGMNHFLLSYNRYVKKGSVINSDAGRYGIHAMELVINKMMKLGARRRHLTAKAFGGGNVLSQKGFEENFFCVGDVNVRFIREFLENEKIPLVSSDLGGECGRVIRFHSSDYSVYVRKIIHKDYTNIIERDRQYWKRSVRKNENRKSDIELWS